MDVTDNSAASRFELPCDGGRAFAAYRLDGDTITFIHTVVPEAAEGHGIGSTLIAAALAQVRERGMKVVSGCAFVSAYLTKHPDEAYLA